MLRFEYIDLQFLSTLCTKWGCVKYAVRGVFGRVSSKLCSDREVIHIRPSTGTQGLPFRELHFLVSRGLAMLCTRERLSLLLLQLCPSGVLLLLQWLFIWIFTSTELWESNNFHLSLWKPLGQVHIGTVLDKISAGGAEARIWGCNCFSQAIQFASHIFSELSSLCWFLSSGLYFEQAHVQINHC